MNRKQITEGTLFLIPIILLCALLPACVSGGGTAAGGEGPVAISGNLFRNGDLSGAVLAGSRPAGWSAIVREGVAWGVDVEVQSDETFGRMLVFHKKESAGAYNITQDNNAFIKVRAGEQYRHSFWVKRGATSATRGIRTYWWETGGKPYFFTVGTGARVDGTGIYRDGTPTPNGEWEEFTMLFTVNRDGWIYNEIHFGPLPTYDEVSIANISLVKIK